VGFLEEDLLLVLWKEGTSLLSKMPKEISLSPRKKTELKALAITVLADRCFRSITLAGAVDSDFFSRSEDRRLFTMGKRVYRKPIILDIIRVAQIYGVEIKQGWREMAQSLEREEDETLEPGLGLVAGHIMGFLLQEAEDALRKLLD